MHVSDAINRITRQWGKPEEAYKYLVPFGIRAMDETTGGIRYRNGGIYVVQGIEGARKTTLVANWLINQLISGILPRDYWILIDTLETGVTIENYAEILVSILATKILIYRHWLKTDSVNIGDMLRQELPELPIAELINRVGFEENGHFVREAIIRPAFLRWGRWTKHQREAIGIAKSFIEYSPVIIDGVSETEANGEFTIQTWELEESLDRWRIYSKDLGVQQLVIDNLQEYNIPGTEYEIMNKAIPMISTWQKEAKGLVWAINQVSVGQRALMRRGEIPTAAGGARAARQGQVVWHTDYKDNETPHFIFLYQGKSRIGKHRNLALPIEPISGAIIGRERGADTIS